MLTGFAGGALRRVFRSSKLGVHCLSAALVTLVLTSVEAHDPINTTVTWNGDIRRLVHARCIGCHVEGGRGPMPLVAYEDARPWARAIREEVLARRMPKWHAARGYGQFANDRSLTPFEIALFVAWVDGGAKRGPEIMPPQGNQGNNAADNTTKATGRPVQALTLPCGDEPLPAGRLLAVRPELHEKGSAGISILRPDGRREVVAWIRGFERKFTETYWLRTPLDIPNGARLQVEADGVCRISVTIG